VGPVYTPPARRGRGFGSAVTADATAAAIAAGADHVVLYTDLSNPTSNAIYQTIGYRVDHDAEERSFDL
jgi:predicted GNAT family acetyltransferase